LEILPAIKPDVHQLAAAGDFEQKIYQRLVKRYPELTDHTQVALNSTIEASGAQRKKPSNRGGANGNNAGGGNRGGFKQKKGPGHAQSFVSNYSCNQERQEKQNLNINININYPAGMIPARGEEVYGGSFTQGMGSTNHGFRGRGRGGAKRGGGGQGNAGRGHHKNDQRPQKFQQDC